MSSQELEHKTALLQCFATCTGSQLRLQIWFELAGLIFICMSTRSEYTSYPTENCLQLSATQGRPQLRSAAKIDMFFNQQSRTNWRYSADGSTTSIICHLVIDNEIFVLPRWTANKYYRGDHPIGIYPPVAVDVLKYSSIWSDYLFCFCCLCCSRELLGILETIK